MAHRGEGDNVGHTRAGSQCSECFGRELPRGFVHPEPSLTQVCVSVCVCMYVCAHASACVGVHACMHTRVCMCKC